MSLNTQRIPSKYEYIINNYDWRVKRAMHRPCMGQAAIAKVRTEELRWTSRHRRRTTTWRLPAYSVKETRTRKQRNDWLIHEGRLGRQRVQTKARSSGPTLLWTNLAHSPATVAA